MALIQCNFMSTSLMRTVPIQVVLPTDKMTFGAPVEEKPFKTLYLLHGIFGNYTDWVSGTRLQSWAQDRNLAVVMPSGDNSFYVDNKVSGNLYSTFIGKELVEFTRKTFPLSRKREDTFIGGLSMGGFGSLLNGLKYHDTFGAICALSSALITDEVPTHTEYTDVISTNRGYYESIFGDLSKVVGGENDPRAVAEQIKDSDTKPKIYMACGTEDGLIHPSRAFRDQLKAMGFDVTWEEGPGGHEWNFWDAYILKAMEWLPLDDVKQGISSGHVSE